MKRSTQIKESKDISKFMDAVKTVDGSIKIEDVTVESSPKGNWIVYQDNKKLTTVDGSLLSDALISKYNLEH